MSETIICPNCQIPNVPLESFFCPSCGAQLRIKQSSTSTLTEIALYVGSLFLPPLGFWWAFKYWKINDPKAKKIAKWCVAITIISLIVSVYLFQSLTASLNQTINSQLNSTDYGF